MIKTIIHKLSIKLTIAVVLIGLMMSSTKIISAQKPFQRKGESYLKISLQAYAFNKLLNDYAKGRGTGMSLYDLMDFCAENNFDAVDLTGYYFPGYPDTVPSDDFIYSIKYRAFELGLDISGTGVRNDFANPDPEKRAKDVKLVKNWVDVAVKLGAPVVRIFSGNIPAGYENRWDEIAIYMAASIRECVDYAKARGVLIAVQNHGDFLKTADETIKLIQLVDSDWFGVIVDTGYFLTDDPYENITKVMPWAVNFLLKESPLPKGSPVKIDLKRIMKILNESGYRGYVPLETLSAKPSAKDANPEAGLNKGYNPYSAVPEFLKDVRAAIRDEYNMQ